MTVTPAEDNREKILNEIKRRGGLFAKGKTLDYTVRVLGVSESEYYRLMKSLSQGEHRQLESSTIEENGKTIEAWKIIKSPAPSPADSILQFSEGEKSLIDYLLGMSEYTDGKWAKDGVKDMYVRQATTQGLPKERIKEILDSLDLV